MKYDPSKQWQWKPDEAFEISGRDLMILNQALTQFITSNLDVPTILRLTEAFGVIQKKMNDYVDKGQVTEFIPQDVDKLS